MTHITYPIAGVPVTRAERYPHVIGPDADAEGDIEAVEVTQLTVDTDVKDVGRVTLSAMADPNDAWGFEFDLEPADARELAKRLVEAASRVDTDPTDPLDESSTSATPALATPTPVIESAPIDGLRPDPRDSRVPNPMAATAPDAKRRGRQDP